MILRHCFLFIALTSFVTSSFVTLNPGGGYEKIVVAISPKIDKSKVESLLFRLEALFSEASKLLQTSTRGRFYFHEISFVLPKALLPSAINRNIQDARQLLAKPDIFILEDSFFENPYTMQHEGCGQPGLHVILSQQYVFDDNKAGKAQAMVREWSHYRYGVFDESGFPDDILYPQYYSLPGYMDQSQRKITDCVNEDVIYELRDKNGYLCRGTSTGCKPVPENSTRGLVESSIMMKLEFPKLAHFCDGDKYRHKRNAPTKQNALCREQSTWEVLSRNSDFTHRRTVVVNDVTPTFKYVVESEPKFILAVDSSFNMAINDRLDHVRNAFAYFAFEDFPRGGTAGIVDMGRLEKEPKYFPLLALEDAESLVDSFPDGEAGDVCVHCGILKALQVLRQDSNHLIPSGTILVATSSDVADQWSTNISQTLAASDVTVFVIYFEDKSKHGRPILERLATSTGGKFFYIPEGASDENMASPLPLLYEAFRAVYESFSWMLRNHVLVDQRSFLNNGRKQSMSFPIDESITKFQVLVTGAGFFSGLLGLSGPLIRDSTILKCEDDVYVPGNKSYSYKMKIPAYLFTIESPQVGICNLTFERKVGFERPLVVIVRAISAQEVISAQALLSEPYDVVNSTRKTPHTLFADVRRGRRPIRNANTIAHVYHFQTGNTYAVTLRDNGNGEPDVTGSDGIYSRYFTQFSSTGYHLVTVVVEGSQDQSSYHVPREYSSATDCCGSFFPQEGTNDPGNFRRVVTSGVFFVEDGELQNQIHPPGRIADLHVEGVRVLEYNVHHYTLRWTAPGADYDNGTASFYELKVFRSRDDALYRFTGSEILTIDKWRIHGGPWLEPEPSGSPQNVIIELRNISHGNYFLAMRAVDGDANVGEVSNVVEVHLPSTNFPTTNGMGSTSLWPSSPGGGNGEDNTTNIADKQSGLAPEVSLAVGISVGLLLLLMIIGLFLMAFLGRRRKDKTESSRLSVLHHTSKTESNDTLCRSTGGVSVITPVSSWPAGSLLAHYEKTKNNGDTTCQGDLGDSASLASTKYSYINPNSSMYDSIYFHPDNNGVNYPFNPSYIPFNPTYTSSLRKESHLDELSVSDGISCDYYNRTLSNRRPQRLKTDV